MKIPIYQQGKFSKILNDAMDRSKGYNPNVGLVFERYTELEVHRDASTKDTAPKLAFLKRICGIHKSNRVIDKMLVDRKNRMRKLVEKRGGGYLSLTTQTRFVTGMGEPHPIENGFRWDPSIGCPYIPSTSIKGALRAWLELYEEKDEKEIKSLLGSQEQIGSLCIFDAYPVKKCKLSPDIINAHYGEYYRDKKQVPPADYLKPNPVFLLTVSPGAMFEFYFAPNHGTSIDIESISKMLTDTVSSIGLGAKTSLGYGWFE